MENLRACACRILQVLQSAAYVVCMCLTCIIYGARVHTCRVCVCVWACECSIPHSATGCSMPYRRVLYAEQCTVSQSAGVLFVAHCHRVRHSTQWHGELCSTSYVLCLEKSGFPIGGKEGVNGAPPKMGWGFGQRAQLTVLLIIYHELWRLRRRTFFLSIKTGQFFSRTTWHMIRFLNRLNALLANFPFPFFFFLRNSGHLRGPGVSLGRILWGPSIEPFWGGGWGRARGLYRPPPPPHS